MMETEELIIYSHSQHGCIKFDPIYLNQIKYLFKTDSNDNLFVKQIYDIDLKDRIESLETQIKEKSLPNELLGLTNYLKRMSLGEIFCIHKKQLSTKDDLKVESDLEIANGFPPFDFSELEILNYYDISTFGIDSSKIGEQISGSRTCRFCGKSFPDVTFGKKAHAISRGLGNTKVICNEECDECNGIFGKTIERDIINFFMPLLLQYGIKGDNGDRSIRCGNSKIRRKENVLIIDSQEVSEYVLNKTQNGEPIKINMEISELKYRFNNIYKCLCKYAISTIDKEHLKYFSKTIGWIKNETEYLKLPLIAISSKNGECFQEPVLFLCLKNNVENSALPTIFAQFHCVTLCFTFILPFCSRDSIDYSIDENSKAFFDHIRNWFPLDLKIIDFSSKDIRAGHTFEFNF